MQAVNEGHAYELDNVEGGTQTLQFIEKAPATPDAKLETVVNGTTNEEVIRVLLDRITYLDGRFPSDYNKAALEHLEAALGALESRTADRKERGVEGTNQA